MENHCLSFRGGAVVIGVENILPGISQILQRHLLVESGEGGNIDFLEYQNQFLAVIHILRNCKNIYLLFVVSRYYQMYVFVHNILSALSASSKKGYSGAPAW